MGRAAECICMQDKCQVHDNVKFGDNTLEMTNRERERERENTLRLRAAQKVKIILLANIRL